MTTRKLRRSPRGCYEDYCHEIDDEAEKRKHEAQECDGPPWCDYCVQEILNQQTEGEENENR